MNTSVEDYNYQDSMADSVEVDAKLKKQKTQFTTGYKNKGNIIRNSMAYQDSDAPTLTTN